LDLEDKDFQELRIVLTAKDVLVSNSPIHLLANYGRTAPTVNQYDLKGVHLWDGGQGIFIRISELK
jgi:hypothetical protein